jgi:hypothetical protein
MWTESELRLIFIGLLDFENKNLEQTIKVKVVPLLISL